MPNDDKNPQNVALTLAELKNMRKQSKASITRIKTAIEGNPTMSVEELECRLGVLESYYKFCCETQLKIERLDPTNEARGELDELYIAVKTTIKAALARDGRNSMNESFYQFPPVSAHKSSVSMLPSLNLPQFNGTYSEFKSFMASYNLLVHGNKTLCNTEKFNLLRQCLGGQALDALSQFPNTNENYELAYARLRELYDNDCLIFLEHVNNLFEAQRINNATQASLRTLVDKIAASYSAIKTLGTHEQICDAFVINVIMSKVDLDTKTRWEESIDFKKIPDWKTRNEFLDRRCQRLEAAQISCSKEEKSQLSHKKASKLQNKSANVLSCTQTNSKQQNHNEKRQRLCAHCQSNEHWLSLCPKFEQLSVSQRRSRLNQLNLCHNCLRHGHFASECKIKSFCRVCQKRHHTKIHVDSNIKAPGETQTACNAIQKTPPVSNQVILATALILIRDANGKYQYARALLDNCSQVNFIREEFARTLRLKAIRRCVNIDGINDCHTTVQMGTQTIIKSRFNDYEVCLEFLITPSVSTYCPETHVNRTTWSMPKNIKLADPFFDKLRKIDVLIGGEIFFDLLSVGQIKLGTGLPTLQKTTLGWLVVGCTSSTKFAPARQINSHCATIATDDLEKIVTRFWQLEEVDNKAKRLTAKQSKCEQFYSDTVRCQDDGRIIAKIPFKSGIEVLGSSHQIALRRFLSLEKKLNKDDALRSQYITFMREYAALGHMETVPCVNMRQPHYYIPHHSVIKPTSTTTKLRVVFDASCKTESGIFLNDIMMVGPTIQNELLITLLNFRIPRYCITGDITKMYRQVLIDAADRRFQLILWREEKTQPIKTYALKTVTYGTSAAPFLAIKSLHLAAERCKNQYPLGSRVVTTDFYVDDLLKVEQIQNHNIKQLKLDADLTSALGVNWDPKNDEFAFIYEPKSKFNSCSKRSILSQSSSLFDPMGFLAPILVRSKILLQELWKQQLNWDESVPQTIFTKWENFTENLQQLHRIKIPRHVLCADMAEVQVHGFCDASIKAYGCVLYARCINTNGKVTSCIIVSKSRVAPTRIKTVPRLELCGALLLATLWEKLKSSLNLSPTSVYFWTDSTVVLHWLKFHSSNLTTFVGNRVAEIQEITSGISWKHVPTKHNPADLISRGASFEELMSSNWIHGPEFLLCDSKYWPTTPQTETPVECETEVKKSALEMSAALQCVVSVIQRHHFANEIQILAKNEALTGPLKSLSPIIDDTGPYTLLRVGGRLQNADISESAKHPLLLPKADIFSRSMMRYFHQLNYHTGPKALVAITREQFWVINAREVATKIVNSCIQCVRYRPKLMQQIMGQLPRNRVTEARPFQHCGVDFFGPVPTYLNLRGKVPYKSYVAVFICFTTKAVHLEAVSDLTTNKFIEALKRMIGRRGLPQQIFCDNATNFVGANTALKHLRDQFFKQSNIDAAYAYCAARQIQFNFIPPRAPHFGGLWEAAVKVAKGHLIRTLSHARLTYEELSTALIEIEAVMNSRPLCPDTNNPNDLATLTPGHAIIGTSLKAIPEPVNLELDITHLQRCQRINAIKAHFWKRWHAEYLHELQNRTKWHKPSKELSNGDMVIIHDDNIAPMNWPIARVESVIRGSDGHVRVAELRTAKGIIKRPIVKLALLPEC